MIVMRRLNYKKNPEEKYFRIFFVTILLFLNADDYAASLLTLLE